MAWKTRSGIRSFVGWWQKPAKAKHGCDDSRNWHVRLRRLDALRIDAIRDHLMILKERDVTSSEAVKFAIAFAASELGAEYSDSAPLQRAQNEAMPSHG